MQQLIELNQLYDNFRSAQNAYDSYYTTLAKKFDELSNIIKHQVFTSPLINIEIKISGNSLKVLIKYLEMDKRGTFILEFENNHNIDNIEVSYEGTDLKFTISLDEILRTKQIVNNFFN